MASWVRKRSTENPGQFPRQHQKQIYQAVHRCVAQGKTLLVYGGVNVFKTSTITWALFALWSAIAHAYRGARYIVAGLDLNQIDDSFFSEWKRAVPDTAYRYDGNKHKIIMGNGDLEIVFRGSGHYRDGSAATLAATKRRGGNFHGVYLVQGESCPQSFADEIIGRRIRGAPELKPGIDPNKAPPYRMIIVDSNPGDPNHWTYQRYVNQEGDQFIHNSEFIRIQTTVETSTYTQEELNDKRRVWARHEVRRMLDAEYVAAEGVVYDEYTILEKPPTPDDCQSFWICLDPGTSTNPQTGGNLGIVVVALLKSGKFCVVEDFQGRWRNLKTFCEQVVGLRDKWSRTGYGAQFNSVVKDWYGGAGMPIRDALQDMGLFVEGPTGEGVREDWRHVMVGVALVREGFVLERLVISPECRHVIESLQLYSYGDNDEPDKKIHDPHVLDALRYGWIRIYRHEGGKA